MPLTALGLIAGVVITAIHTMITDFPIDMVIYREGVQAFIEGREVYSEPMQAGDIALPFIYPPFGAFVMIPLAAFEWMDHNIAGNIMITVSNLLILACLYFVFRALNHPCTVNGAREGVNGPARVSQPVLVMATALVWALVLAFEPVSLNNGFAQLNIVVMALVVFDLVPRRRKLPQGWLIGLAAAIKLTPLAMLLYFLLRKDFKAIITAGVSALVATAIAAVYRWDTFVEFFSVKLLGMFTGSDVGVGTSYQSNSSIKGALERAFTSPEALADNGLVLNIIWLILAIATVVAGSALMLKQMKLNHEVDAWLTGALVMLFISPVSWSHHWIWLTLILPVFAYRFWTRRHATWVAGSGIAVLAAWVAMLVTVPPKWWFGDQIDVFGLEWYQKFLVSDFLWLTVIMVALYVYILRLNPTKESDTAQAA